MANSDIRINLNIFQHPKFQKLKRRLKAEGVLGLLNLYCFCGAYRIDGLLRGMDEEDIAIASNYSEDPTEFINTLIELKLLDTDKENNLAIHDWIDHNPYAAGAIQRGDKARFSKLAQTDEKLYLELKTKGYSSISKEEYAKLTNPYSESLAINNKPLAENSETPAPDPSHSPEPSQEPLPSLGAAAKVENIEGINKAYFTLECYHEKCTNFKRVLNYKHEHNTMIKELWDALNQDEKKILELFSKAAESDYLNGGAESGWLPDFEWLINKDNALKVLSGKYKIRDVNKIKELRRDATKCWNSAPGTCSPLSINNANIYECCNFCKAFQDQQKQSAEQK